MAFVLSAFLSEGLFICLVAAALLWADEGRWRRVAMVGALLPLARPVGIVIMAIVGLIYLQQNKWSLKKLWQPKTLWVVGPLIGFAALLVINYAVVGNPLGFVAAERGWGRGFLKLAGPSGGLFTFQSLYLISFVVAGMAMVTAQVRKLGWIYWLLSFCLLVLPGLTGLYGLVRYTEVILPIYLALGLIARQRPSWQIPIVVVLTFIQGVHLVWWSLGMPIMQ